MTALLFNFHPEADRHERERVLSAVREAGARTVEPLFPGEDDDELARMFVVESPDDVVDDRLLALLEADPAVESVEEPPRRRLMR